MSTLRCLSDIWNGSLCWAVSNTMIRNILLSDSMNIFKINVFLWTSHKLDLKPNEKLRKELKNIPTSVYYNLITCYSIRKSMNLKRKYTYYEGISCSIIVSKLDYMTIVWDFDSYSVLHTSEFVSQRNQQITLHLPFFKFNDLFNILIKIEFSKFFFIYSLIS